MLTRVPLTLSTFGLCLGLLAGCPSGQPAANTVAKADNAKAGADKAADKGEADKGAHGEHGEHGEHPHGDHAKGEHAAHDEDAEGGAHEGCIYVEGENTAEGELECPHAPKGGEAAEPDAPPDGDGHFGAEFALEDATPLSKALAAAPGEAPILVSGEVEAVCQKKGCWMVVKDGAESARVLMKDHGFAVPMDCRGKSVQIEGTLTSRTFTETQVKHLEKDAGRDPEAVSGERTEHVLTATGIRIQS